MQERVNSSHNDFADVLVSYGSHEMQVGVGLEMSSDKPNHHFIDQIYGGTPTQTAIGKLFAQRLSDSDFDGKLYGPDFQDSDSEAEWHNELGRAVLDAVTASKQLDGLWSWFDRPAVNRLIRLLRKARDASFGADA